MKRKIFTAVMASIMALTFAVGTFGCSKGNPFKGGSQPGETVIVEDDGEPWFSSTITYLSGFDSSEAQVEKPVTIGDKLLVPYTHEDENGIYKQDLLLYSKDGKFERQIDPKANSTIESFLSASPDNSCSFMPNVIIGNKVLLSTMGLSEDNKQYLYDITTNDISSFGMLDDLEGVVISGVELDDGTIVLLNEKADEMLGELEYELVYGDGSTISRKIDLTSDLDEFTTLYSVRKSGSDIYVEGISCSDPITLKAGSDGSVSVVDITTGDDSSDLYTSVVGGNSYGLGRDGFYKVNNDGSKEAIFSYDDGNLLRSKIEIADPISVSDNEYVFAGCKDNKPYLVTVTKYEHNPNVGKEYLELGTLGNSFEGIDELVVDFNNQSDKYFIQLVDKYTIDDDSNIIYGSDDELSESISQEAAAKVDQLAIDLLAGEAPDIMLGCAGFNQLENTDYLMDLSEFASQNLSSDKYFNNIIETSKKGGSLFVMPLTFNVNGIYANVDGQSNKSGFTYEEYKKFVSEVCNGLDPLADGRSQLDYMQMLFEAQSDLYLKDGQIDLNNDSFKALVDYCKENIPELPNMDPEAEGFYEDLTKTEEIQSTLGTLCSLSDYDYWAYARGDRDEPLGFTGYPSLDGRGPSITSIVNVSISSTTGSAEGAMEFLKFLVSDEGMTKLSSDDSKIVLNKDICKANAESDAEAINRQNEIYRADGIRTRDVTSGEIDTYMSIIENASATPSIDPKLFLIIREEIPGYCKDQKSWESVVSVISDRAQTAIDETK